MGCLVGAPVVPGPCALPREGFVIGGLGREPRGTGLGMSILRFFFFLLRPRVDAQPAALLFCSASQSTPSRCPACCASFLLRLPVDSQSISTLLRGAPGSNSACGKPPKVPGDTPLGQPRGSVSPAAPSKCSFFVVVAGPGTLVAHYSASPRALPPGRRARPGEGGRVQPY